MPAARRHPNHRPLHTLPRELRRTSVPDHVRTWIQRETGSAVVSVRRLPGASTSAVHRIELATGTRLVLRRYVWRWLLDDEPDCPTRELDALQFAAAHALPAPQVVAADPDGAATGDGVPAMLMTFLPGRAVPNPDPWKLAEVAAAIHAVDPTGFAHDYFPWGERARANFATTPPPPYRPTFIHRDFHPGNVLWTGGSHAGTVDWAEACRGPAGCDVAHCRANLVRLAGADAADAFTRAYESITGERFDPYWDIANDLERDPES